MNKILAIAAAASAVGTLGGCATYGDDYNDGGWGYYDRGYYSQYGRYDYNNPDPRYGGYYADRYYRADPRYHERVLTSNDRVYRGSDGNYYCRRSDGSTGTVVAGVAGAVAGSLLGNIIAPGGSNSLGAVLGALGGAAAGAAIADSANRDGYRCR